MKSGKVSHLNHQVHRMQANRISLGWDGSGLDPMGRLPCQSVHLLRQRGPQERVSVSGLFVFHASASIMTKSGDPHTVHQAAVRA
jgi:hypothetical protein